MMEDFKTKRQIPYTEAKEIALRLMSGSFRRDGERLDYGKRPNFTIPTRPEHDDDCLILSFIEQQAAQSSQQSERISELLRFNNEFEERARKAERENKLLRLENEELSRDGANSVIIQNWFDLYRELDVPPGGSLFDAIMEMKRKMKEIL